MDGRRKAHGRESVLAIARQKQKNKVKMDSGFRRNDEPHTTSSPNPPLEGEAKAKIDSGFRRNDGADTSNPRRNNETRSKLRPAPAKTSRASKKKRPPMHAHPNDR